MAFTAVAYPQVGHGNALVFEPANAAGHHFAHAGEVVDAFYRFNDKLAVVRLVGPPVLERHEACHGICARKVRNVDALDAERSLFKPENLLQFKDALVDFAVLLHFGAHFNENHIGVRACKLQESEFFAALGRAERDLSPCLFA